MPKNVVCKKCNNLVNDWCEKVIDSPDPDMQRDCQHFCEKTNADRIRSMSDEELCNWLFQRDCTNIAAFLEYGGMGVMNAVQLLDWLQQPAE